MALCPNNYPVFLMHNTFVNRECNTVDIVSVGIVSIEDSEEDSGASNEGGTEVIAEFEEAEADAPPGSSC